MSLLKYHSTKLFNPYNHFLSLWEAKSGIYHIVIDAWKINSTTIWLSLSLSLVGGCGVWWQTNQFSLVEIVVVSVNKIDHFVYPILFCRTREWERGSVIITVLCVCALQFAVDGVERCKLQIDCCSLCFLLNNTIHTTCEWSKCTWRNKIIVNNNIIPWWWQRWWGGYEVS